jgi:hypothetical protein
VIICLQIHHVVPAPWSDWQAAHKIVRMAHWQHSQHWQHWSHRSTRPTGGGTQAGDCIRPELKHQCTLQAVLLDWARQQIFADHPEGT